jgi:ribosomal protein S18 acetylase RimI-like enzyme
MRPVVRDALPRDGERVAEMVHELAAHEGKSPGTFTAADFRRDGFGTVARFRCVVVEADGSVVGYASYYRAYDMTSATHGLHLLDLFVAPRARNRGCGTALLRAVGRRCAEAGGEWLCFHVRPRNARAAALYRRLGACDLKLRFMAFDAEAFAALQGHDSRSIA